MYHATNITSREVKHILTDLLLSYEEMIDDLYFMGNISTNTIIAVPNDNRNSQVIRDNMKKPDYQLEILKFKYRFIFNHVDMLNKNDWIKLRVNSLLASRK